MNKNNAKDYLPLVQAMAEGKEIEILRQANRTIVGSKWETTETISDGLPASRYRIKPEPPKPREFEIGLHIELRKNDDTPCCISPPWGKLRTCTGEIIRVREIIEEQ